MSEPRLRARLRVQALLRQAAVGTGAPGAVVRRGDDGAGSLLVLLRLRDERLVVLAEARAADGTPGFLRREPLDPAAAQDYVDRAVGRDPDLWVVEFDAPDGHPPFPARML